MSLISTNNVSFSPSSYSVKQIELLPENYQAIVYDKILSIKIPSSVKNAEEQIRQLELYLFGTNKATVTVTGTQLSQIFSGTNQARCDEIAALINKYSDKFEINTPLRMSHFLAQTGYETDGFKGATGESGCYTTSNSTGWDIWFKKQWSEPPFGNDCDASLNPHVSGSKKLKWTALTCNPNDLNCFAVPTEYVCTSTNKDNVTKKLFSYVYQCEGGNGNSTSLDGFTYRGHGAIQLTWKKTYQAFDTWLKTNYKDIYKDVVANPSVIDSNDTLFILSAMWFWKTNGLNELSQNDDFKNITLKVNKDGLNDINRKTLLTEFKNLLK
jgi:predicted chitinase